MPCVPAASVPTKRKCDDTVDASLLKTSRQAPSDEFLGLLAWLRAAGSELDGLEFRPDGMGGVGAFAARAFANGDTLATVPRKCMLTAQVVRESELGTAVLAAATSMQLEELCTEELLIWIFMCVGRVSPEHPFHPYLAALPTSSPDPTCWPLELKEELKCTTLFSLMNEVQELLQNSFDVFVSKLPGHIQQLIPKGCLQSVDDLHWARGMCLSRAFCASDVKQHTGPEANGDTDIALEEASDDDNDCERGDWVGADGKVRGSLLPLLDVLNHRQDQPIAWIPEAGCVRFQTEQAITSGDEVYNDYGRRANEELLFTHGFCVYPNPMDVVSLLLPSRQSADSTEKVRKRFCIHSQAEGGIPDELWQTIAATIVDTQQDMEGEQLQDEGCAASAAASDGAAGVEAEQGEDAEEDNDEVDGLQVGPQHAEILLMMLHQKLEPLQATQAEDELTLRTVAEKGGVADRKSFVAMYRQGQRDILGETIVFLDEFLKDDDDEEEPDAESE